jgi:hypothetical protein
VRASFTKGGTWSLSTTGLANFDNLNLSSILSAAMVFWAPSSDLLPRLASRDAEAEMEAETAGNPPKADKTTVIIAEKTLIILTAFITIFSRKSPPAFL